MKTKILFGIAVLSILISCSGSSAPPFEYQDNTRVVVEGQLLNEDLSILPHQLLKLYSGNTYISAAVSDDQGKFFITSPKGNYPIYLIFNNKNVKSVASYPNLIKSFSSYGTGLGYFEGTYYNFNQIILMN